MIYIPNVGEREALRAILSTRALILGLYKNNVVPDGNTIFSTLEELTTGGGRGYARKALTNTPVESGTRIADRWTLSMDSNGKAQALYTDETLDWIFNAADVADGNTAYGVFGFCYVIPFTAGLAAMASAKPGDTIEGGTSAATGIITAIEITDGAFVDGDAEGFIYIMTKTGTFQDGEALEIAWYPSAAEPVATSNTGAEGDANAKLMFVDAFSTAQPIDTLGFTIQYPATLTMQSA